MSSMNKNCEQRSPARVSPLCLWVPQMAPEAMVTLSPGHVASLGLQRMKLLNGDTGGNAWVITHFQKQNGYKRLWKRVRPRNRKWDLGSETWAIKHPSLLQGLRFSPASQWTYLDSHHGRLGSTAGTPPCLPFPRTALPPSTICISCHLVPPQPRAQPLQGFCLLCAHLWVPKGPLPCTFIM